MAVVSSGGTVGKKKKPTATTTIRKATKRAVRKGISGPTEDSLGITKNEGSPRLQKAVKKVGYDKAVKVASKTRLRKGQTYKGGKGWVSAPPSKKTLLKRGAKRQARRKYGG